MAAGKAVSREEQRDATAVSRWPFLVLTVTSICRERSFPNRFAKIFWHRLFFLPACRVRWIREPGCGRRPIGISLVSKPGFDG
jgi:hypothetical protein